MNKVKRSLDNQAIGLVPLLLFMFLDNYFSYLLSFIIGVTFCFVCIFLFQILSKDKVYQFLLLPAATTLVLYSIFLCLRLEPVLFIYSPLKQKCCWLWYWRFWGLPSGQYCGGSGLLSIRPTSGH